MCRVATDCNTKVERGMMSESDRRARIGWIGVGRMGLPLAGRLQAQGHDLAVWNRTRSKAEPLEAQGATVVDAVSELADRDIVFVMVSASDDLKAVTIGTGGVLSDPDHAPRILVDSSTVSIEASSEVRAAAEARGTAFLAAPVSGNPKVVGSGRATLAVSGPGDAWREAEPVIAALGREVTYVGTGDAARLVKICHNLMLATVAQSLAEITVLAEKGGVSRSDFLAFLNDSVMGSTFTRYKTPALVGLDFTPTFTAELLRKDLDLGLDAAADLGATLPLSVRVRELVQTMIDEGLTAQDFAALLVVQARDADLELVPEEGEVADGLGPEPDAPVAL